MREARWVIRSSRVWVRVVRLVARAARRGFSGARSSAVEGPSLGGVGELGRTESEDGGAGWGVDVVDWFSCEVIAPVERCV